MTTATLATGTRSMDTVDRPRRSLEELVDQLMAAMGFKEEEPETASATEIPSVAKSVHEARRLRQAGDVDGALAVLAGVDAEKAETREARWAFSEWTQLVKRRFGGRGALVYSQGTGRAAALVPTGDDGTLEVAAVLGMRWRPGKVVSGRSLRGLRPLHGGAVMVTASVHITALKARHPLGDTVEAAGVRLRGRGRVRQGVCPFHDEAEGSFTVYGDSERFYCFGCGEGGDVLDFIQRAEGLSLPEAIARLDGSPGLAPRAATRPAGTRRPKSAALPPRDPALLTAAARFYAGRLRRSPAAWDYLASRGVGPVAAARLGLGFAPDGGLRLALESLGFSEKRIRDSGLLMERGAERFAGMVVVPDVTGGLVRWLAGRAVAPGRTPRFQALPRLQAGAGSWASRPRPCLGGCGRGPPRLARPYRMGPSGGRGPGHPGHCEGGGGLAGLPSRLPRLRLGRRGP